MLALALGVLVFLVFAVFAGQGNAQPGRLWVVMAMLAGMMIVARIIVPRLMLQHMMKQISHGRWRPRDVDGSTITTMPTSEEGQLMMAYQKITIVSCALLEGAGMGNVLAYMVEKHWASLTIACVHIGLIAFHFPVRSRVDAWIESRLRWLKEDRDLNSPQHHGA